MFSRSTVFALAVLLLAVLVLTGCRAGEPASPQTVFMRMDYAAPVAGDRAIIQILEAEPNIPYAMIGIRCDDTAQQLRVTADLSEEEICQVRLRLEEVVLDNEEQPRAVRVSVHWGQEE